MFFIQFSFFEYRLFIDYSFYQINKHFGKRTFLIHNYHVTHISERQDCKMDDMCPKLKGALNEIEINQTRKEKSRQEESGKFHEINSSEKSPHMNCHLNIFNNSNR